MSVRATLDGTLSTGGWRRRAFRLAMVVAGFWIAKLTPESSWLDFGLIASTPYAVLGLLIAAGGALTSSGADSDDVRR